jgi:hypothetical protein
MFVLERTASPLAAWPDARRLKRSIDSELLHLKVEAKRRAAL